MTAEERWTRVAGRKVRFREAGSGPVILFAPGLGLSCDFYQPNLEGLAALGFRAIAADLPGFGRSSGSLTGLGIDDAADWLLRFASTIDAERGAWVGHSVGCQVALAMADSSPGRTEAVVLAGPTGARGHRRLHQISALSRVALSEGTSVLLAVGRDYLRTSPTQYLGAWLRAARDEPLDRAPRILTRVLILVGSLDPVPPPNFIAELAGRLRFCRVEHVPGGRHALPIEQPDDFNRRVADFLRSHADR